ncbi:MAG: DUF2254 domain-containing protein [Sphingomonas sp.]|nr:DUF2254 domain-containing protein [Sphingomonas sp.]
MQLKLFRIVETIRSSYWFLPSVMAAGALVLGVAAVWLDAGPGTDWLDSIGWYQKAKPDAAREMLSAIAGSMITVAGVVFSITIVAIAFAAAQYGPRVLTNFMADRGNQLTLGTFIGTFVYSLVVLRTIHSGDTAFVPQFAVLLGIFLALCSIAVLIFFVHHVPRSIHVNSVIGQIGSQLAKRIEERAPISSSDEEAEGNGGAANCGIEPAPRAAQVRSYRTGYVKAIDQDRLVELACKHDLLARIVCAPGDFAYTGRPLVEISPTDRLTEECCDELHNAFAIGASRTPAQDMLFLVDELVEITARALSTGVNDPFTAITCIDWMGAATAQMAKRGANSDERRDEKGALRLIIPTAQFETLVDRGFGRARSYVAGDVIVARHALGTLSLVSHSCRTPEQVETLRAEANALMATAEVLLKEPQLPGVRDAKCVADSSFDEQLKELGA